MKHIVIITLVLMSFISSPSWGETMDDLMQREGTYYKKFSEVPFTGQVEGQYQGSFKNGLMEGSWVGYLDNGQLSYKGDYKNGEKEGYWERYHNDKHGLWLESKGYYKNGNKEGYWEVYKIDGSIFTIETGTYKDGWKIID